MRIQHNIMAMSAYRNYTNNVSAMKKNLEKLSSGYKINRAGDDAAGLAISEKMRAQITGLQTAQKNAKDGISLVQTAEGALTEVHDMLNRMVELATQSANGTYSDTTDREQLQKEVEQLKEEINRIADSSNFNGLKLLDGSMAQAEVDNVAAVAGSTVNVTSKVDFTVGGTTNITTGASADTLVTDAANRNESSVSVGNIALAAAGNVLGANTIAHATSSVVASRTRFSIDLHDVKFENVTGNELTIQFGTDTNAKIVYKGTASSGVLTGASLAAAIKNSLNGKTFKINGQEFQTTATTGAGDGRITFQQVNAVTSASQVVRGDMGITITAAVATGATFVAGAAASITGTVTMPNLGAGKELNWKNSTDTIGTKGLEQLKGRVFSVNMGNRSFSVTLGSTAVSGVEHQTVAIASNMTMATIASKITAAMGSAVTKGITTAATGTSAANVGFGYGSGNAIYVFTNATFAIATNGTMSVTNATGTKYVVTANGTLATGVSSTVTVNASDFDYSDRSPVKVPASFDWTDPNKADTSALVGKEIKVNIGGKDYTVKLVSASTASPATNEVKLDLGGEKASNLLTKIEANLKKQIDADNDAGATSAADYKKITNISVTATTASIIKVTATSTPMTYPKGSAALTLEHYNIKTTDPRTASYGANKKASTTFDATPDMFADGGKISFGNATYTFKMKGTGTANVGEVDLRDLVGSDGKLIASKVGEAAQRLADAAGSNAVWTVGASKGKLTFVEKGSAARTMTTASKVAADFKLTLAAGTRTVGAAAATTVTYGNKDGKSLTLQIGDTADPFNQLKVDIRDCHANAMGITTKKEITTASGATKIIKVVEAGNSINDINIGNQSDAAKAVDIIKAAINYVSDVRGGLGATQNRLDHTINNLSVMTENIQDAESTIRDVDVAEEMMAYTKNNILIQSAQAMLAQANQVPQGVLQLLQ